MRDDKRLKGESRRRTKVIPRFPPERGCLTLLSASLVTASKRWRGVAMTPAIVRYLQALRAMSSAKSEEAVAGTNGEDTRRPSLLQQGWDLTYLIDDDRKEFQVSIIRKIAKGSDKAAPPR